MHRRFSITVPSDATDRLVGELRRTASVVTVSVHRGAAVQPPGDVVDVEALNRAADAVWWLSSTHRVCSLSVSSSQVASLSDRDHAAAISADSDESTWEDATAGLRHPRPADRLPRVDDLGGIVAGCALCSSSTTQATALVAAAVIAPGFEPLAKFGLDVVLRQRTIVLRSALVGYVLLATAGAVTMLIMRAAGTDLPQRFLHNGPVLELAHPTTVALMISGGGAVAGAVMIAGASR